MNVHGTSIVVLDVPNIYIIARSRYMCTKCSYTYEAGGGGGGGVQPPRIFQAATFGQQTSNIRAKPLDENIFG